MFNFVGEGINRILDAIVDWIFPLNNFEMSCHEHEEI